MQVWYFIGPPASAIEAMGDKALAKRRMLDAGVPCAPGYLGAQQDDATLIAEAEKLGYPLLVKAVAGGGGRGMRLVRAPAELQRGIEGARREATSAFGDGTLMLERLIEQRPPHRNPGFCRCARQRGLPGRARLHGPAPPPEGHRRGSVSCCDTRHA